MANRLTLEQTKRYLIAWREYQDRDALTVLVECNQALVNFIANKYLNKGLTHDELVSSGNMGLLNAINRFDYEKYPIESFSGFLGSYIKYAMQNDIRDNNKHAEVLSYDAPLTHDDDDFSLEDILGTDSEELFNNVISEMKIDIVREALKSLTHHEQEIILLRYGIDSKYAKTQQELAYMYGCSRQAIILQEKRALIKMRHPRNTKKLKDFLDD